MKKMDFNTWYKKQIESNQEYPPDRVWEEIHNTLDIDLVWNKLDKEIPVASSQKTKWAIAPFVSIAATLAFFMVSASILLLLNFRGNQQSTVLAGETEMPDFMQSIGISEVLTRTRSDLILVSRSLSGSQSVPAAMHINPMTSRYPLIATLVSSAQPIMITRDALQPSAESWLYTADIFSDDHEDAITPVRSFYVGMSGQLANTWLLNSKTIGGLQMYETTSTLASYGESFGFTAGKGISNRIHLEMGLDIISRKQQRYHEYIHGRFVETRLHMDYTKLSIHAGWNISSNSPFSLVAGMYSAYLRGAEFAINGQSNDVRPDYRRIDYGLLAGFEFSRPVLTNLHMGAGFYSHYGLTNIFSGNQSIPRNMGQTQLLSFHAGLHLRYHLR